MVTKPEVLAVIPARGGSKGVPHKNIRLLAGYPLIAYSIAAAKQSESVTRIIVSTDDDEISEVAREWGAEVPFLRPAELARDETLDFPVFEHALIWLAEKENYIPDVVLQLRPTSPLRPFNLVDQAVALLLDHPEADSVRGIVPAGQNPHKMWRVDAHNHTMTPLLSVPGIAEPYNSPRQKLPPVFWQTGHIDAIRPSVILNKKSMSGDVILGLDIDPRYAVDIDSWMDFGKAEWLIHNAGLEIADPASRRRSIPNPVKLVVMDFDGVLTDNRVWVDQDGRETVAAYRSDSLWLSLLRESGVDAFVISKETNPVVAARCRKMNIPHIQSENDKKTALQKLLSEKKIDAEQAVFIGNDVNDLPCFPIVGWAVAVADAIPEVARQADFVLSKPGGHGAVQELCSLILDQKKNH